MSAPVSAPVCVLLGTTSACAHPLAGVVSPRIVRSTLYNVPNTDEVLTQSKVPFCLVVQPLAGPNANDDVVPHVDHGAEGPVRCRRCKAYINPGVVFVDGGRRFQCNLCRGVSEGERTLLWGAAGCGGWVVSRFILSCRVFVR